MVGLNAYEIRIREHFLHLSKYVLQPVMTYVPIKKINEQEAMQVLMKGLH
jgi:hypothetical protein